MSIDKLLKPDDLLTLGGAVAATIVVTNGLCYAFTLNRRIIGLIIAMAISFIGFYIEKSYAPTFFCVIGQWLSNLYFSIRNNPDSTSNQSKKAASQHTSSTSP